MKILFFLGDLNLKDSIFDSVLADSTCVPKKDLGFSLFFKFSEDPTSCLRDSERIVSIECFLVFFIGKGKSKSGNADEVQAKQIINRII
ncbi:hypothetical protein LEP1GSC013_3454 [Leptospira interrogans serovar Valbuzzi str. Duyster]|nr:hypothetical protein LEP1GSC013_3454 [Leptospira interrogans serovar Valbuzzi str. Duyster]ENO70178.1 hypothetical protein LEP1GSC012_4136 [Leptospira interrogans serovar Valbuzzi str. Valbuzzi]